MREFVVVSVADADALVTELPGDHKQVGWVSLHFLNFDRRFGQMNGNFFMSITELNDS